MSTATVADPTADAVSAPPSARGRPRVRVDRALPWLLVVAALVWALDATGVGPAETARYLAYWLLGIVLPGTLVHRALRGSRGNIPEDAGYGAACGLLLELLAWVLYVAFGTPWWVLRVWPAVVVVVFLAVPALRRHWRIAEPRPASMIWAWSVAAALAGSLVWMSLLWHEVPLPPVTTAYYQDLLYHLSLTRELMRPLPFHEPQYAGDPLYYHVLADAHFASASLVTGSNPATVLMRLWYAPVLFAGVLAFAALARELSGRAWAGPVAAFALCFGQAVQVGGPPGSFTITPVSDFSPSTVYLLPFLALLAALCAAAVRGQRLGAAWALVPLSTLACAGAKFNAPPVVLAGLVVATAAATVARRRVPWGALAALGLVTAATAVGRYLFVDRLGRGVSLQWFSTVQWSPPYRAVVDPDLGMLLPGAIPPGLIGADAATWRFVVSVAAWYELAMLPVLIGLLALGRRGLRRDPAVWFLAGVVGAGSAALWVFFHPSVGQAYFLRVAMPLGMVLAAWLAADATRTWRGGLALVGILVAAGVTAELLRAGATSAEPAPTAAAWREAMFGPWARVGWLTAAAVLAWWALRAYGRWWPGRAAPRTGRALAGRGLGILAAAVLGASVAPGAMQQWRYADALRAGHSAPTGQKATITAAEMRAAIWLDEHAAPDDVVATNVHCQPVRTWKTCDARSFWVSGLSGRTVLLEGWGYTPAALAGHGTAGLGYSRQPPREPERLARNDRVFSKPTAEDVALLRTVDGVRWLLADERAGPVSPALGRYAVIRYVDGPVAVYEVPAG
ncbi:MAG TPA: hypothetical protein VES42_28955 [Pilimelia sp.]|nr:hypothetical protein [Pilimelia sp.]